MSPLAPKHPCGYPGCIALIEAGNSRCERDRIKERQEIDRQRGSAAARGYDSRWRAARKEFLGRNPLCAKCYVLGMLRAATVVDHAIPYKNDSKLFWAQTIRRMDSILADFGASKTDAKRVFQTYLMQPF